MVFMICTVFYVVASAMDGEGGDFTVVETSRTAAPRKTKCTIHSLFS